MILYQTGGVLPPTRTLERKFIKKEAPIAPEAYLQYPPEAEKGQLQLELERSMRKKYLEDAAEEALRWADHYRRPATTVLPYDVDFDAAVRRDAGRAFGIPEERMYNTRWDVPLQYLPPRMATSVY